MLKKLWIDNIQSNRMAQHTILLMEGEMEMEEIKYVRLLNVDLLRA